MGKRWWIAVAGMAILAVAAGWLWSRHGMYGVNVLLRRGGSYWVAMPATDPRLSPAMRAALRQPVPATTPGTLQWKLLAPGYEAGTLPVIADGREVDRILLVRVDPARYRFTVRNDPAGTRDIDDWERALPWALLIVNASYYDLKGLPDTPIVSEGKLLGPRTYEARAGAFVEKGGRAAVTALADGKWQAALAGADNAMVSYPLLVGADGRSHVKTRSRWLANRSFVAETRDGRIIVGTTREAFFSLDRLADFLAKSPLNLRAALNLDGGPIACQSVRAGGYHRKLYAKWEAQVEGDQVQLLSWPAANAIWAMPMVLTVERR